MGQAHLEPLDKPKNVRWNLAKSEAQKRAEAESLKAQFGPFREQSDDTHSNSSSNIEEVRKRLKDNIFDAADDLRDELKQGLREQQESMSQIEGMLKALRDKAGPRTLFRGRA